MASFVFVALVVVIALGALLALVALVALVRGGVRVDQTPSRRAVAPSVPAALPEPDEADSEDATRKVRPAKADPEEPVDEATPEDR